MRELIHSSAKLSETGIRIIILIFKTEKMAKRGTEK